MLCHIVTGLRHLLLRPASMRISQASVAEMLQKLSAARTLALPMLARAAICATGKEHLPDVWASFRMTASTAIASVFRQSATSGGAITVAARNLRPHTRRGLDCAAGPWSPPSRRPSSQTSPYLARQLEGMKLCAKSAGQLANTFRVCHLPNSPYQVGDECRIVG
jgi:hypothetical protein